MRIEKGQLIGPLPAMDARRFMRNVGSSHFAPEALQETFPEMSNEDIKATWDAFLADGYIEFTNEWNGRAWYQTTTKGNALAHASAAKPVSRATAEIRLKEFMERVEQVNQNDEFAYRVNRVILFGSLLTDVPQVSDVDLMIELAPRLTDKNAFEALQKQRIELAKSNGRRFSLFIDELYWPQWEIHLYLKARSPVLSLHEISQLPILKTNAFKMLLGQAPESLETL